jgi:hypothetical protein
MVIKLNMAEAFQPPVPCVIVLKVVQMHVEDGQQMAEVVGAFPGNLPEGTNEGHGGPPNKEGMT